MRKDRGFWAKPPSPSSTSGQNRAWGGRGRQPWAGGLRGSSAPGERGKREGRPRGIESPPHLERGWGVAAWPRWCTAANGDGRGGGAAGVDRELAVAAGVCGGRGRRKGPIYRPGEVGRRGRGWWLAGGSSAAINGVGAVWASRSGAVALRRRCAGMDSGT